jgi:hypothetical protein
MQILGRFEQGLDPNRLEFCPRAFMLRSDGRRARILTPAEVDPHRNTSLMTKQLGEISGFQASTLKFL